MRHTEQGNKVDDMLLPGVKQWVDCGQLANEIWSKGRVRPTRFPFISLLLSES